MVLVGVSPACRVPTHKKNDFCVCSLINHQNGMMPVVVSLNLMLLPLAYGPTQCFVDLHRMRDGGQVRMVAIGPNSVNQAIKSIAIARTYLEEDAIDLAVRPVC